jgi:hypothetical protein
VSKHTDPMATRRLVVGVLSWAVFAVAWWLVLRRDPSSWLPDLAVPVVSLVVVTVLTLAWVRHNLGIYRRKGPRRGLPAVDAPWTHDSIGRPLVLPQEALTARFVTVDVVDGLKAYEVRG